MASAERGRTADASTESTTTGKSGSKYFTSSDEVGGGVRGSAPTTGSSSGPSTSTTRSGTAPSRTSATTLSTGSKSTTLTPGTGSSSRSTERSGSRSRLSSSRSGTDRSSGRSASTSASRTDSVPTSLRSTTLTSTDASSASTGVSSRGTGRESSRTRSGSTATSSAASSSASGRDSVSGSSATETGSLSGSGTTRTSTGTTSLATSGRSGTGETESTTETTTNTVASRRGYFGATFRKLSTGYTGRRAYFVRTGERVDRIFPKWLEDSFEQQEEFYVPKDLNMPVKLPRRRNTLAEYAGDGPITEIGFLSAQMVGRGMYLRSAELTHIFVSPALRCIQTAVGILRLARTSVLLRVEPGLFETVAPQGVRGPVPAFYTAEELESLQYPVDLAYTPVLTLKELTGALQKETPEDSYRRIQNTVSMIMGSRVEEEEETTSGSSRRKAASEASVLFVGHGLTTDAGARKLMGFETPRRLRTADLMKMGLHYPYCSTVGLEEQTNGAWCHISEPVPTITYLDLSNRPAANFLLRVK